MNIVKVKMKTVQSLTANPERSVKTQKGSTTVSSCFILQINESTQKLQLTDHPSKARIIHVLFPTMLLTCEQAYFHKRKDLIQNHLAAIILGG